jgi:hypothetical protein
MPSHGRKDRCDAQHLCNFSALPSWPAHIQQIRFQQWLVLDKPRIHAAREMHGTLCRVLTLLWHSLPPALWRQLQVSIT